MSALVVPVAGYTTLPRFVNLTSTPSTIATSPSWPNPRSTISTGSAVPASSFRGGPPNRPFRADAVACVRCQKLQCPSDDQRHHGRVRAIDVAADHPLPAAQRGCPANSGVLRWTRRDPRTRGAGGQRGLKALLRGRPARPASGCRWIDVGGVHVGHRRTYVQHKSPLGSNSSDAVAAAKARISLTCPLAGWLCHRSR